MALERVQVGGAVTMSANQWVYEKATGKWMLAFRTPAVFLTDPVNYGIVDLGDAAPHPDPILERFDAVTGRRAATPAEVLESQNDQLGVSITSTMDVDRLTSAIVWTIIDTFASPATVAKYLTARAKIIAAFKAKPWVP